MKKVNKFLILAIILTVFYWLIGQFIMSNMYLEIPKILFWITDVIYLGVMGASAIVGVIGVKKIYKAEQTIKWGLLLLTIFNISILIANLSITIFPEIFIK